MADLYTTYETSVALRDAGAPQGKAEKVWYYNATRGEPKLVDNYLSDERPDPMNPARAFRADEIIEALGADLDTIEQHGYRRDWRVIGCTAKGTPVIAFADSFVEALAAAWLAVLKEGK